MPIDDGGPAFPATTYYNERSVETGMSLRDYLAAHAPATSSSTNAPDEVLEIYATNAYRWADAMLEARKARKAQP